MYDWTIDGMLRAGFSKKMADYLHGLWKQEKESGLWAEEDLDGHMQEAFWQRAL